MLDTDQLSLEIHKFQQMNAIYVMYLIRISPNPSQNPISETASPFLAGLFLPTPVADKSHYLPAICKGGKKITYLLIWYSVCGDSVLLTEVSSLGLWPSSQLLSSVSLPPSVPSLPITKHKHMHACILHKPQYFNIDLGENMYIEQCTEHTP